MASEDEEDGFDMSEWDDVLCAEPEKVKPKDDTKTKDTLNAADDDDEGWGDVIAIEVLENYCSNLMKQMEVFRKQGTLCDAVIVVDDRNLPVHKNVLSAVSPFFKNIFSQLTDPDDSRITLRNLTGQIMDDILHFTYTGEVCIHDGNVRQLVATANFLQLQNLKEMAISYLEQKLSPASAVEILLLADKHNCRSLIESAEKLISDNFVLVSKTDGFKKLTFEILYQLVQSEDIRVLREEEVYEAVMLWVKSEFGDQNEKENQLLDLLQEVRFPLMSPSYLNEIVERDEMIRRNPFCYDIVKDSKNCNSPNNMDRSLIDSKLLRPRKFMGVVWSVVCIGGWLEDGPTRDVYAYLMSNYKWFPLTPLPKERYSHSVVSCDGFIYILGGRDKSTRLLSSVMRFDPGANKWQAVAPLPYEVASMGVCVFEGQIFVVGGLTGIGSIDVSLRYSARNNVWQRVANLNFPRGALSIVADEKYMYALGGIRKSGFGMKSTWEYLNSMEIFHRESNSWSSGPEMLSKRAHGSAVYLNQRIYLVGGQGELLGISKGLDVYNTISGEWFSTPYLGIPRSMCGIAINESQFFIIGGMTKEGDCVDTVETYDVIKDRWTKVASLPIHASAMQCCTMQLRLAVLQGMTTSLSQ